MQILPSLLNIIFILWWGITWQLRHNHNLRLNELSEWFVLCLSQNISSIFYNTCQSSDTPPWISDELRWNKMTHIHNLAMDSFSTDFAYIWSQAWICVFILNNCATYCFYLHGYYTSTYIANISLVWRRMGLWKYKMCVSRCCGTKVRNGMTQVLT